MDNKAIAEIIERVNGDGFTGEDYDAGWHDAVKGIAEEFADYQQCEFMLFNKEKFMTACGL